MHINFFLFFFYFFFCSDEVQVGGASRWRSGCESISQCRRVQGSTVIELEQFGPDQTTYTEVITFAVQWRMLKFTCVHGAGLAPPFDFWKTFYRFFIVEALRIG